MNYQFDTTILNGLPVTIEFETTGYDNRDCGHGVNDVNDWWIVAVAGKWYKKHPDWITNKLTQDDEDAIIQECYEHIQG